MDLSSGLEIIAFVAMCIVAAGILACVGVFATGYVNRRLLKTFDNKTPDLVGYKWCCPAGLGCNDPNMRTACRRNMAISLATDPGDMLQLDAYWSALNANPNKTTLRTFQNERDRIIDHAMTNMTDVNPTLRRLTGGTPRAEGEVVDDGGY